MPDFEDSPSSEGATNVALTQRAATAPFAREEVNIRGNENVGRALGFNEAGALTTLLVGGTPEEPSGPVELVDMAPLPSGTVIGRKSPEGGTPEAVTVAEMIALDPAASKTALGKVALADMANLAQGKLIARASSGTAVPEAVTVAQMIALDPVATKAAIGKIALSDMANLARGTLITRVSTSPNPGVPEAMTLSQLIAIDPEAIRVTLGVSEDPFVTVDTEAQFNTALASGRSMVLRGEGTGGVISLTTEKVVGARHTTIKSDNGAVLRFGALTSADAHPRAITVHADDVTLQNFELTSTIAVTSSNCYGLVFSEGAENHGHRLKVLDMRIYNWQRSVSKDGSSLSSSHDDVLFERCHFHTVREMPACLNFGFNRLHMRDCRLMGWLTSNPGSLIGINNGLFGGSNWRDCVLEECYFGNVARHGFEATPANYSFAHENTKMIRCTAENCGAMGFSLGFVTGGLYAYCRAKNVKWVGFELAGSVPGDPDELPGTPGGGGRLAQGVIDSCEVDGITVGAPFSYGISIDGAIDSSVRGATIIRNISTTAADVTGAFGIALQGAQRCSIQGVQFVDAGYAAIAVHCGHLANSTGFHDISNNVMRNPSGYPSATPANNHRAISINDQCCRVKNNTAYQKSGTFLGFQSVTTTAGAVVVCDEAALATGSVNFGGTNLILNG